MTKEENKEQLRKVASVFDKILKVIKILLIIGMVIAVLEALGCFILGVTDAITTIYEKYPNKLGNIKIGADSDELMFIKHKTIYLKEIYADGDLDKLMYGYAVMTLGAIINMVVFYIILHYIQKIFVLLENNESPFSENLLKPFKITFIILTILIMTKSVFFGILTGGLLACMYFIYKYGCNMQEDEDHTL